MTKHIRIEVNGIEYVNGDFAEISFTDGPAGVRLEAKLSRPAPGGGSGGGLLEMLAGASKARTEAMAEEKRAALAAGEPVEAVEAGPVG